MKTFDEAMGFINSFSRSGSPIKDLSRAEELMRLIGNPEKKLKFVHIAGTNGKGSTVEYISNALIFSGYKTGQFTSPFILRYNDRIRINGKEIDDDTLCELAEQVRSVIDDAGYSQFEITMAIAMLWYMKEECDVVVLECGIGGLLDCTNVIPPPLVSVITSISLDHTAILGDTVEKIAEQKAGIIKHGSAAVISPVCSAKDVLINKAKEVGAELILPEEPRLTIDDIYLYGSTFISEGESYRTKMPGYYQYANAVTAAAACRYLRRKGFEISEENIRRSVENTVVLGRMQFIQGEPPVIVDGGHNPEGIKNLEMTVKRVAPKNIYAVMGMVDSKDYREGVTVVSGLVRKLFAVDGFAYNSVKAEKLAEIAGEYTEAEACRSLSDAVEKAKALAGENNGMMLVCGSLYLASEYLNEYEK